MEVQTKDTRQIAVTEHSEQERTKLVKKVRRWGGFASDAALDPKGKIFSLPEIDGMIGYYIESGCALVFGDPICSEADIGPLTKAFHEYCKEHHLSIIYISSSEKFAKWAIENVCSSFVEFGDEMTLDPQCDIMKREGSNARLLRKKVKHALHEDILVSEYLGEDPQLEKAMEQVAADWLKAREGLQIYICDVYLFEDRFGKRWFYAQQGDSIVGVLMLNQLQARNGWVVIHLMQTPEAPNGTAELIVITAIEALRKDGFRFITFGATPSSKLGEIVGFSKFTTWLIRRIFHAVKSIFRLDGRRRFWEKFDPKIERSYLLFSNPRVGVREIRGLMKALNVKLY